MFKIIITVSLGKTTVIMLPVHVVTVHYSFAMLLRICEKPLVKLGELTYSTIKLHKQCIRLVNEFGWMPGIKLKHKIAVLARLSSERKSILCSTYCTMLTF